MSTAKSQLLREITVLHDDLFRASVSVWSGEWAKVDLTFSQLQVLFHLYGQPPSRMTMLASALGLSLPACTSLVDRLVRAGMVERRKDPSDRRVVLCALSRRGRALIRRLWEAGQAQTRSILGLMSVEDLRVVAMALRVFLRAIESQKTSAPRQQRRRIA